MIPLLIALAITVTTQEPLTSKERYAKFLDQHNQRLIEQVTEKIAGTKQRLDPLNKQRPRGRDEKKALRQEKIAIHDKIKVLKSDLARLNREKKSKRYTWPRPRIGFEASVGSIGPLLSDSTVSRGTNVYYSISQIISETEMLATCKIRWSTRYDYGLRTTEPVLIRGMSTKGRADKQKLDIEGKYFEVTGTYQYKTVLGSMKTVIVLEPFDATGFTP